MLVSNTFQRYQEAFLRLLYPAQCGACRVLLELEETGICGPCLEKLEKLHLGLEQACLEVSLKNIRQTWALYSYQSPFKEILASIKFHHRRGLLKIFKKDLQTLGRLIASEHIYDSIIPIPLDPTRLMERQFNQSELIASVLGRALNVPVVRSLHKSYRTPSQHSLHRKERLLNLRHTFDVRSSVAGKSILLVDDVLTTGATAEEAARILKEKGARHIDLVTLACNPRDTF